jgi:hypothetical protein
MIFGSENGVLALIFFFYQNIMPPLLLFFIFLTQHIYKSIASPRKAPLKDKKFNEAVVDQGRHGNSG